MNENYALESTPGNFEIFKLPVSGASDGPEKNEGPSRPGDLPNESSTPTEWADYFAQEAVVNMVVPVADNIRQITEVPNYTTQSTSDRPIVWRTRDAWYGLDGCERIDEARRAGRSHIECRVHFKANCTNEDLAFGKAATRTKTEGGPASYAELVAVSASVAGIYTLNRPGMFTNPHGGLRVPGQNSAEADDDLVNAMRRGLGKSRKTILRYLNHCEFLETTILKRLAAEKVGKSFFDSIQEAKRKIVNRLSDRGLEPDQIAVQVSEAVDMLLDDFLENNCKLDQETIDAEVALFTAAPVMAGQQESDAQPQPMTPREGQSQATSSQQETELETQEETGADAASREIPPEVITAPEPALGTVSTPDEPQMEHQEISDCDKKIDEVTGRLAVLTSQASNLTDDAGLKDFAKELFTYAFELCSELLPQEFEAILEELKAARVG